MKYCLRNRQIGEYLAKADEIKMEYRDYKSVPDLFEKYPEKNIIVQIKYSDDVDFVYHDLIKNMRLGKLSDDDIDILNSRVKDISSEDEEYLVRLYVKKSDVEKTNLECLDKMPGNIHSYQSVLEEPRTFLILC